MEDVGKPQGQTPVYSFVLACYRYIEMNPVRAGMVGHPREYRWSSYRVNAEGRRDRLITPHADYTRLGRSEDSRRESYRSLFKTHLNPEIVADIRRATNGNYVLGSKRFQEEISRMLQRRVVPGKSGRPVKTDK